MNYTTLCYSHQKSRLKVSVHEPFDPDSDWRVTVTGTVTFVCPAGHQLHEDVEWETLVTTRARPDLLNSTEHLIRRPGNSAASRKIINMMLLKLISTGELRFHHHEMECDYVT